MYKFEIHLHTNNCSACAVSSPTDIIDAAVKNGYSGIVITNHFYRGNTSVERRLPWRDFVNAYAEDYFELKEYGDEKGITVFFGIEEAYAEGKEMLIYGLEPDLLAEHPEFILMSAREISDFVHENSGICVCAHPFRDRSYIPEPNVLPEADLFDAVECFNLFNNPEENEKAFIYAANHKKVMTSGGDIHRAKDFGGGGIEFEAPVYDYETFIKKVKNGDFKLIYPEF